MKVKAVRIGELATQANVSTSKIRFYEARGLLPLAVRHANGYREYGDYDLDVLKFIARAQGLGFTLSDVAAHLNSPRGERRKARLQARLEEKLAELDAHMEQVRARRVVILDLLAELRDARPIV